MLLGSNLWLAQFLHHGVWSLGESDGKGFQAHWYSPSISIYGENGGWARIQTLSPKFFLAGLMPVKTRTREDM